MEIKWLEWAKQIQAIAQIGLTYTKDPYDIERYEDLRQISIDILSNYTLIEKQQLKLSFANYSMSNVERRNVDRKPLEYLEKLKEEVKRLIPNIILSLQRKKLYRIISTQFSINL